MAGYDCGLCKSEHVKRVHWLDWKTEVVVWSKKDWGSGCKSKQRSRFGFRHPSVAVMPRVIFCVEGPRSRSQPTRPIFFRLPLIPKNQELTAIATTSRPRVLVDGKNPRLIGANSV